jgi:hypothetical protein
MTESQLNQISLLLATANLLQTGAAAVTVTTTTTTNIVVIIFLARTYLTTLEILSTLDFSGITSKIWSCF